MCVTNNYSDVRQDKTLETETNIKTVKILQNFVQVRWLLSNKKGPLKANKITYGLGVGDTVGVSGDETV